MLRTSSARFGLGIFAGVLALGAALLISPGSKIENWKLKISEPALAGTTTTAVAVLGNAVPAVTSIFINNASSIVLTANATTSVSVSFIVSDQNGCSDVFNNGAVTTTLYRSGVSTTCAVDYPAESNRSNLNCYVETTTTYSCVSTSTAANATTTFYVYYFAEATDASSSYPSQAWTAYVAARDGSTTVATTSPDQELLTLLALNIETSSIDYGTVAPGTDTTSTNQTASVKNAGNSSTSLRLHGNAMTSGSNAVPTSSQHYATTTFTYGTNDNPLQGTATDVPGFSIPGLPLGVMTVQNSIASAVSTHPAAIKNNYIYILGGWVSGVTYTSTVLYAPIGSTGSIGTWATTTPLPSPLGLHPAVINGDFIYVVAGWSGPELQFTSTVLYAPIGTTGTLGQWSTTTELSAARGRHPAVVSNNNLYIFGGGTPTVYTSSVLYVPVGSTGSIGTWATTTAMPSARGSHPAVVSNNNVYVLGGYNGSAYTSTVLYAPIGSTGSLGTWLSTTRLPTGTAEHPAVANKGNIYVIGGYDGSNYTSTIIFAPVLSSGALGSWSVTTPLSTARGRHPAVVNNGFFYTPGGYTGTLNTSTVLSASLASRDTYWGLGNPAGTPAGTFSGQNVFTAVFQP